MSVIFRLVHLLLTVMFAKVSHISAAPSQDAASLGWFIPYQLSSACAKVSHLLAASRCLIFRLVHPLPTACHLCLPRAHTFRLFGTLYVCECVHYMYKFLDILIEFVAPQASCIYCHLPVCLCVYYNHLSVCFESYPTG